MPETQSEQKTMLGDAIDTLTSEIRSGPTRSPSETLEYACSRLALIKPISSAGMFRLDQGTSSFKWIYRTQPVVQMMDDSLRNHHDGLSSMFNGGDLVQVGSDKDSYFVGLPAGQFDGGAIGLGISTSRELNDGELARLGSFGFLIGLAAENARLRHQMTQTTEIQSTARLIGFIAHELRTPLTGMRGNVQLALMATRKEQYDRIPTRLEAAISSVDDMSGLVQQLLDVSRLERGAFTLTLSEARLEDTVARAATALENSAADPTINLPNDSTTTMAGDHDALEKSITILLRNIGNYADRSQPVEIETLHDGQYVGITLSYTGNRFSGSDLQALTEPLSIARPGGDSHENLSLELAFCRGIITRHGGKLSLHADPSNPGKQLVEIRLPQHVDA